MIECPMCGPICIENQDDGSVIVRKDGKAVRVRADDINSFGKVRAIREALTLINSDT